LSHHRPQTNFEAQDYLNKSQENMTIQEFFSKTWFGFDLDDTLHEFRQASAHASTHVFQEIHASNNHISVDTLRTTYQNILRSATANAFTDGRSSTEYRRERFGRLLQERGLVDTPLLERLLEEYRVSLRENLTLKEGALHLLQTLQQLGKKVIVITEGPSDAQEWSVQELGIRPYVDVLVTTNEIGLSKVDGLFGNVLEKYNIAVDDIVYFGDNEVRDIQAARAEGMLAVLYNAEEDFYLEDKDALRVNSWAIVENILVRGE
jgi:putative hydrolase of the HAD superfamily